MKKVLVTGSSGFIGNHLTRYLKNKGYFVVGADIVKPVYEQPTVFYNYDLRNQLLCTKIFDAHRDFDEVYNLGCLMGGMGFIGDKSHSYDIMVGSTQIVSNIIECCIDFKVNKSFYSSSACVYNMCLQETTENVSLKESDAYPAMPDLMYGWQKLQSELMYQSANEQHGLDIRIARFHNIFGEEGTWYGGKEKAPAAMCRKVAEAKDGSSIEVWGDGKQTRSFLYVKTCIDGIMKLMESDCIEPLNIGSDELVSIDELANMAIAISGKKLTITHNLEKPQGVRGRNSNNDLIQQKLGWKPDSKLIDGMSITYDWISNQIKQSKSKSI